MAAIYSNGGNPNIFGFNFTKRDALSSVYKISMATIHHLVVALVKVFENNCNLNKWACCYDHAMASLAGARLEGSPQKYESSGLAGRII
jgi:hypothetical protein